MVISRFTRAVLPATLLALGLATLSHAEEKSLWQKFKDFFSPMPTVEGEGPEYDKLRDLNKRINTLEGKYSRERRPNNKANIRKEIDALKAERDALEEELRKNPPQSSSSAPAGNSAASTNSTTPTTICKTDTVFVRDTVNFIIFATAATCIKLAQQWYWAEKALKDADAARIDAELSNLRNQINPHFLLNTLNNIYALTAFDTQKAQESIQELSKMLRHILYDYQQPRVPLQDETEFIDNYVKLMRIRLPNSVEVVSKFHVLDKQADVAPMIFISLVENAFKHGVSPTEPSFIHITIEGDRKHVICDIKNSNYPKAEGDHSGHGIGLQQVQRRLELSYYQQYTWEYGVSPDGKTFHSRILITPKRK